MGDEFDIIKSTLKDNYRILKDNYKVLSSIRVVGGVFGIDYNTYNDYVCNKINIVDGNEYKLFESDLLF